MLFAEWEILVISALVVAILAKILLTYRKHKFPTIKYALTGLLLIGAAEMRVLISVKKGTQETMGLAMSSIGLVATIGALYCILLFIEAFSSETPFTTRNAVLGVIVAIVATGMLVTAIQATQLSLAMPDEPPVDVMREGGDLHETEQIVLLIFLICVGLGFLTTAAIVVFINLILTTKIKECSHRQAKKVLIRMRISTVIFAVGGLGEVKGSFGGLVIALIAYGYMFWTYSRHGVFILQDDSLRRLIVMNDTGLPVYSYIFREFTPRGDTEGMSAEEENVLFTGALQAVSMLLSEFTGANQAVKEIRLDRHMMMVRGNPNSKCTIILFTDKSTQFFTDALSEFAAAFFDDVSEIRPNRNLGEEQTTSTDLLVQQCFGVGDASIAAS